MGMPEGSPPCNSVVAGFDVLSYLQSRGLPACAALMKAYRAADGSASRLFSPLASVKSLRNAPPVSPAGVAALAPPAAKAVSSRRALFRDCPAENWCGTGGVNDNSGSVDAVSNGGFSDDDNNISGVGGGEGSGNGNGEGSAGVSGAGSGGSGGGHGSVGDAGVAGGSFVDSVLVVTADGDNNISGVAGCSNGNGDNNDNNSTGWSWDRVNNNNSSGVGAVSNGGFSDDDNNISGVGGLAVRMVNPIDDGFDGGSGADGGGVGGGCGSDGDAAGIAAATAGGVVVVPGGASPITKCDKIAKLKK